MISCRTLVARLLDYVGREMPTEHCELVEEHLARCPQCVAFEASYRRVVELARSLPPVRMPPELIGDLWKAVHGGCRNR